MLTVEKYRRWRQVDLLLIVAVFIVSPVVGVIAARSAVGAWFLILISALCVLLICRKSMATVLYLLLAAIVLLPKTRDVPGLATARVDEFLVFPLLILLLVIYRRKRGGASENSPRFFAVTFGIYVLTTFLSLAAKTILAGQGFQIKVVLSMLQLLSVFLVVYYTLELEPGRLSEVIRLLFILALIAMIIGFAQRFDYVNARLLLQEYYGRDTGGRVSSMGVTSVFGGNPNHYGAFLVATNVMLLARSISGEQKRIARLIGACLLVVSSYALFASAAKWAIVVQLVVFAVLLSTKQASWLVKLLIFISVAVAVYLVVVTLPDLVVLDYASLEPSILGRDRAYTEAVGVLDEGIVTVLFGYGYDHRWIAEGQYSHELYRKGVIGLLGFAVFFVGQLIFLIRRLRSRENPRESVLYGGFGLWLALLILAVPYAVLEHDRAREWYMIWLAIVYHVALGGQNHSIEGGDSSYLQAHNLKARFHLSEIHSSK